MSYMFCCYIKIYRRFISYNTSTLFGLAMLVGWPFASVAKGKCTEQLGVVHLSQVLGKLDLSSLCSVVGLSVSDLIM